MKESDIEASIVDYAVAWGFDVVKDGQNSEPDRRFMKNGYVGFMEIKKPGGLPSEGQMKRCRELITNGFDARFIDDVLDGKLLILEWLREIRNRQHLSVDASA